MKITRKQLRRIINEALPYDKASVFDVWKKGPWKSAHGGQSRGPADGEPLGRVRVSNPQYASELMHTLNQHGFDAGKIKPIYDNDGDNVVDWDEFVQLISDLSGQDEEAPGIAEMKITRRQLRRIIREAIDTQLSRAISKGNLPDARPDEKRASRRAERRFGKQQAQTSFDDDYPSMSGLGPADDHLESITSQDMADAKRYARSDLPRDQADYLDISVDEWHRIRQELDDHYEARHMDDQLAFDDDPDVNDDGMLSTSELVSMVHNIVDDIDEDHS